MPRIWEISSPSQLQFAALFHPGESFVRMPAERTCYKTLYVPTVRAPFVVSPGQAAYLRQQLRTDIAPATRSRKLYISRADAAHRQVVNEAELVRALEPLGFESITLRGRTVTEQIALFKNAETIVMPHGSAGVNIIFSEQLHLIELMPQSYQHPMWQCWAKWMGFRHGRIVCPDDPVTKNLTAPIDVVLAALRA
jgi:capsular polysaccharide biosynthesis protein